MRLATQCSVAAMVLLLAGAMACDDDGPASGTGPPPPPDGGDTTAPQPVTDLALTWRPGTDDVEFAWTAPRDDDETDRVAGYDIRYSYSFPFDWDLSVVLDDLPAPEPEGTPQTLALASPIRGRDLYAAARTWDAAGNMSAIGPVTHVHIPGTRFEAMCEDIYTKTPIEGLDALLTTTASFNLVTGADGLLVLDDVAGGTLGIRIDTGTASFPFHRYENTLDLTDDVVLSVPMIRVIPPDSPLYPSTLAIVIDALVISGSGEVLKRWHTYPIPWYAPPAFVNVHGLDYTALTRQAAAQWNLRTGMEIFVEVPAIPAAGIELRFLPRAVMGIQNGITEHKNDALGFPAGEIIKIVDDFSDQAKLYSILMHEFGHTIRLNHLPAGFLMYAGQPLPSDVTDDEARTVQMMLAIPNGTDLGLYDPSSPAR